MEPNERFPQLWLYSRLDRVPFPKSYVGKLLAICFLGTHVPLIGFIIFALSELDWSETETRAAFFVVLGSTLLGTAFALLAIHAMMAPVSVARVALSEYRRRGQLPQLPTHFQDAAGILLREVDETLNRLDAALSDLASKAHTDPLTRIANRRALMDQGKHLLREADRTGSGLTLAIVDLDGFKRVNDQHGHLVGDNVLASAAKIMKTAIGERGFVGRLGGDEFCILLPGRDLAFNRRVWDQIRHDIAGIAVAPLRAGDITASIGVAEAVRGGNEGLSDLLSKADTQLYAAKAAGRNTVALEHDTPPSAGPGSA